MSAVLQLFLILEGREGCWLEQRLRGLPDVHRWTTSVVDDAEVIESDDCFDIVRASVKPDGLDALVKRLDLIATHESIWIFPTLESAQREAPTGPLQQAFWAPNHGDVHPDFRATKGRRKRSVRVSEMLEILRSLPPNETPCPPPSIVA